MQKKTSSVQSEKLPKEMLYTPASLRQISTDASSAAYSDRRIDRLISEEYGTTSAFDLALNRTKESDQKENLSSIEEVKV